MRASTRSISSLPRLSREEREDLRGRLQTAIDLLLQKPNFSWKIQLVAHIGGGFLIGVYLDPRRITHLGEIYVSDHPGESVHIATASIPEDFRDEMGQLMLDTAHAVGMSARRLQLCPRHVFFPTVDHEDWTVHPSFLLYRLTVVRE